MGHLMPMMSLVGHLSNKGSDSTAHTAINTACTCVCSICIMCHKHTLSCFVHPTCNVTCKHSMCMWSMHSCTASPDSCVWQAVYRLVLPGKENKRWKEESYNLPACIGEGDWESRNGYNHMAGSYSWICSSLVPSPQPTAKAVVG